MQTRNSWLIPVGIIVLFFALRIPFLHKEYVFEETFLVKSAEAIAEGGYPAYYIGEQYPELTVNLLKPPLFVMSLAAMYKFFGSSEITSRLVPLLFNLGTLLLLLAFAKRFFARPPGIRPGEVGRGERGKAIGYFAGFLFAIHPFFIQNSIQVDLDGGIVSFFAMLFVYVCAGQLSSNAPTIKTWLILGSIFFLQFATKFEPALMVAFAVFLWLIVTRKPLRTIAWYCVALFAAVNVYFLLFYAYNLAFGHPEQTIMPFFVITNIFNLFFIPRFAGKVIDVHQLTAWQGSVALASMFVVWFTPPFLLAVGLLIVRRLHAIVRQQALLLLFMWFSIMAFTYFLFGNTGPGYPRYFAPVLVPVFLLLAYFGVQACYANKNRRKLLYWLGSTAAIFALIFTFAPELLFLQRKLLINLDLLKNPERLLFVAQLGMFWVIVFLSFLIFSFWKRIGFEKIFIVSLVAALVAVPFFYVHDVFADYSLTNVYGEFGFRASAKYLREHLPEDSVILTSDSTGYYYGQPYFDFDFSQRESFYPLALALQGKHISAIALSKKQLETFARDARWARYISDFHLQTLIGTQFIFIRNE